ncbi:hypothetical protein OESDEN_17149 [Oesophagostomum dentatum]|uniref:Uncharacterized protein n=1 Tax=Oesophagostomum dentatum TaxID=61180 RepID=A0A0B1SE30_OESDE|nr:hypothetical protein OESDEN_17149 [Oesophagostomum dentatum]
MQMYPRRGNDFSSIARRLLLGRDHASHPQVPFRSIGVAPDTKPTNSAVKVNVDEPSCSFAHGREIKAEADHISDMKPHYDEMMEDIDRCCDLCDRIRNLSSERLRAPLEKPRGDKKISQRVVRFDMDTKMVIHNVRRFFAAFRKELGYRHSRTIFKSVLRMTSLACGVSKRSLNRILKDVHVESSREKDVRAEILQRYGTEWGAVVRHFVLSEFKQCTYVSVTELYSKLCCASTDFPFSLSQFRALLRSLGFKFKRKGCEDCVLPNDEDKVKREYENGCEDAGGTESNSEQSGGDESEGSDYEMGVIDENILLDGDATSKVAKNENSDVNHV